MTTSPPAGLPMVRSLFPLPHRYPNPGVQEAALPGSYFSPQGKCVLHYSFVLLTFIDIPLDDTRRNMGTQVPGLLAAMGRRQRTQILGKEGTNAIILSGLVLPRVNVDVAPMIVTGSDSFGQSCCSYQ